MAFINLNKSNINNSSLQNQQNSASSNTTGGDLAKAVNQQNIQNTQVLPDPGVAPKQIPVQEPQIQTNTVNVPGMTVNEYKGPVPVKSNLPVNNDLNLQSQFSPVNTGMTSYLDITETRGASDLHFSVGYPPLLRIDSVLQRLGSEPLQNKRAEELFKTIVSEKQWQEYIEKRELDFSFQNKSGTRFRVNYYFEKGNYAAALRLIPSKIKTVNELGLPPMLSDFAKLPHGLVLVTGPTGSGKSTTLAALIDEINHSYAKHIITIEDPIEYVYQPSKALIDQREVGKDTLSWTNALKYVLRQDPDVVLVGEMRDLETIAASVTVAETGHLVFATLHTNSAAQTVDRIIDVFPEHQQAQMRSQLAVVLQGIISQRLIPLSGGGRKAAIEILLGNSAVRNTIREGKTYQIDNLIQTSADAGMISLEKSLADMVKKGEVTLDTALEYTTKPNELKNLINT